jgi:tetratricopeptide (TPR) repeat protein
VGRISSEAVAKDDAPTASRKLGVPNVLTGSVRRTDSTIRVSAQLIDGRTGIERWSQHYDRAPGDTIKIQTDIAMSVAQALSIALGRVGRAAIAAGQTANAEAHNLLLQARELGRGPRSREVAEKALALIDRAIALDPGYADAYAHKSMMLNAFANGSATAAEMPLFRAAAWDLAKKALALAPASAAGPAALAFCRQNALDIAGADAAFRQAIRLAPGNVDILGAYMIVVSAVSPLDGVALAERVLALDPLNPGLQQGRVDAMYFARRYAEVVQTGQALERKAPRIYRPTDSVAFSLILLGKLGEARAYLRQKFAADDWQRRIGEMLIDIRSGSLAGVPKAIQAAKQIYGATASYQYGQVYAQLGDLNRAFVALDDAWNIKDVGLFFLRADTMLDPLRSDPRFPVIERKLNFP